MNREILRLAVPFIISNITVPLLSSVDTALMGHLGSTAHLGAVGLGSAILNFLYWNFAFLRMALAGMSAQAFGADDRDETARLLYRSLAVALVGASLLLIFRHPLGDLAFAIVDGDADVEGLALTYFHIRIFAAPATIALYAITGWFIGMQNAVYPMAISILVNVVNLGASFLFVAGFGMTSEGVALGTVIAQYVGLATAVGILLLRYRERLALRALSGFFDRAAFRGFFTVNTDIFLRTLSIILVLTFYNFASASQGKVVLGVNVIFLQLVFAFSFFVDGFANAAEAIVGRLIGEKNQTHYRTAVRCLFLFGAGLAAAFTLGYVIAFGPILSIFTEDPAIQSAATRFAPWIVLIPIVSVGAFVWDGIYLGATATSYQRDITLIASALFFVIVFLLDDHFGNHALLFGQLVFFGCRSLLLTLMHRRAVVNRHFPAMH